MAPTSNDSIAHRESLTIWFYLHGKFGNDRPISVANFFREPTVLRWIQLRQSRADHRNGASFRRERTLMRSGVDSARETADYGQARVGKLIRQFLGRLRAVMRRAPRADNANGVMIALLQFTPNIKHNRRRVNLAQRFRVRGRLLCDHRRAEFADAIELGRKIDNRFPVCDLICNFVSDSFRCSKLAALRGQNSLGFCENFQQFSQPHRPHGRQHVQRDAGFSGVHWLTLNQIKLQ